MDTQAAGQVGGLECDDETRRALAAEAGRWACKVCGRSNEEVLKEAGGGEEGGGEAVEEKAPEELRLAYREELGGGDGDGAKAGGCEERMTPDETQARARIRQRSTATTRSSGEEWLDVAIYIVALLLAFFVAKKLINYVA